MPCCCVGEEGLPTQLLLYIRCIFYLPTYNIDTLVVHISSFTFNILSPHDSSCKNIPNIHSINILH